MKNNAYILDWTMDEYDSLKQELSDSEFEFEQEEGKGHIKVTVPFDKKDDFGRIVENHLTVPNYVDIQFPEEKTTVVVFQNNTFTINNQEKNEEIRKWAIEQGLPEEQADWVTNF
jgi:hypothetical protein